MSERKQPIKPEDIYGFSENEQLFDRINHEHFLGVVRDIETTVHQIQVSSNNYGEFLFVATSREQEENQYRLTFWGLGYHESRERWIVAEWYWYEAYPNQKTDSQRLTKEEVEQLIQQRLDEIDPEPNQATQSRRGLLFEMLAELTDEDGAYTELEDLGDFLDDFFDED
jgi:hypothetical protein